MTIPDALRWFVDVGVIREVLREIESGKESQIYLCRRAQRGGASHLVAKVYIPRAKRAFKGESVYRTGWFIRERTIRKAVSKMSRYGRAYVESRWVEQEFQTLRRLWSLGADVPVPVLKHGNAFLMSYIGDGDSPAPKLDEVSLRVDEARAAFDGIMRNLSLMIGAELVHGDLSPYNILYWEGRAWIIDLPQTVNIYENPNAMDFLHRDLGNICGYFNGMGLDVEPGDSFRELLGIEYFPGKTYHEHLVLNEQLRTSATP